MRVLYLESSGFIQVLYLCHTEAQRTEAERVCSKCVITLPQRWKKARKDAA